MVTITKKDWTPKILGVFKDNKVVNNSNRVIRVDASGTLLWRYFLKPGDKVSAVRKCTLVVQDGQQAFKFWGKNKVVSRYEKYINEGDKIADSILKKAS